MSDAKLTAQENGAQENEAQEKKSGKKKIILGLALSVLLAGGAITGFYFIRQSANFVITENARVTTTLFYVMPPAAGTLERFTIRFGDYVRENDLLGWVEGAQSMRAPAAGLVVRTFAEQNQTVSPGEPVAVIADTGNLHIQANIEETYIANIRLGQSVDVTIDALGRRRFTGYVYEIGRITDAAITGEVMSFATSGRFIKVTQLLPVRINIIDTEDIDLAAMIGLNARVQIDLRSGGDYIARNGVTQNNSQELPAGITVRGTVESAERRSVVTTLGHMIRRIYVQAGDPVTQGQIMAVLDSDDLTLTVTHIQAESAVQNARIELQTRQMHYEGLSVLYNAGSVSRFELRQAEDALAYARSRYADAQALLNAAFVALGSQLVRAPIDGFVTAVFAREGAAGPGLLFVVEDTENLKVRTRFREDDVGRIRPGMSVEIRPYAAFGGAVYTGIVSRINPAAVKNELGETALLGVAEFEAEVAVVSQNTSLRIGMNARLAVVLD
ncbi:MAG: efflux RND transporter periplasmic adaptor subunit [Spirochaetes bacterium]|nr:efflux RND transporter periplasmic adaptor subunit [Spirochaetota bacterium]